MNRILRVAAPCLAASAGWISPAFPQESQQRQFFWGTAGLEPYCHNYSTCRDQGPGLEALLRGLLAQERPAAAVADPSETLRRDNLSDAAAPSSTPA